jgi:hypothetical protein
MERDEKQLLEMLERNGATEIRSAKHRVWRLPNGHKFTVANTPSCPRAYRNALHDLRRLLGQTPTVAVIGERREKKPKPKVKRKAWEGLTPVPPQQDSQLRGLLALRDQLRPQVLPQVKIDMVVMPVPKTPMMAILEHIFGWFARR